MYIYIYIISTMYPAGYGIKDAVSAAKLKKTCQT